MVIVVIDRSVVPQTHSHPPAERFTSRTVASIRRRRNLDLVAVVYRDEDGSERVITLERWNCRGPPTYRSVKEAAIVLAEFDASSCCWASRSRILNDGEIVLDLLECQSAGCLSISGMASIVLRDTGRCCPVVRRSAIRRGLRHGKTRLPTAGWGLVEPSSRSSCFRIHPTSVHGTARG